MLPIEVSYDDETRQIEITGGDDLVGQVSLRDADGNILAFSTEINTVLEVPSSYTGTIIVHIEGENWISVGEVIL